MDYEKEYKQLHKFIGDLYPHMSEYCKEKVEGFFPELRKSEDERVKQAIVHILYENYTDTAVIEGVEISEIITWLEKQEDKVSKVTVPEFTFDDILALECCMKEVEKKDEKLYNQLQSLHNRVHDAYWLGREEEQKSPDKVEPKFKVGEWIVANDGINTPNGSNTFSITNITCGYESSGENMICGYYCSLEDTEGVTHYPCLLSESFFHPWTINDAKDGDVLTYLLDDGKVLIMIYEGLGKSFDGEVYAHALLDGDGYFSSSVGSVCCKFMENLTPATKEQRDLLFQRMAEAGYKWNEDKKELSAIL